MQRHTTLEISDLWNINRRFRENDDTQYGMEYSELAI